MRLVTPSDLLGRVRRRMPMGSVQLVVSVDILWNSSRENISGWAHPENRMEWEASIANKTPSILTVYSMFALGANENIQKTQKIH